MGPVGALARRAWRVFPTHLQMRRDPRAAVGSVRAVFDGPVELVDDGDAFAV
jgi:hypothetical protein